MIASCRLNLMDGLSFLAYLIHKDAYDRLCEMLSLGNLRTEKSKYHCIKQRFKPMQKAFNYAVPLPV
jgi:error-prone DNA polymerase